MGDFVPYIFSIFSNPPKGQPDHLRYLDEERTILKKFFDEVKANSEHNVGYEPQTDEWDSELTIDRISAQIELFRNRSTIIHYSGHATKATLNIQENTYRADSFIKSIKECGENLKVVVLNACSTQGFVRKLLEITNVKAVIATDNPVCDDRAMIFAEAFYKKLLEPKTLAEAFTHAANRAMKGQYTTDTYILKTRIGKPDAQSDPVIIEGYVFSDDKSQNNLRAIKGLPAILDQIDQPAAWGLYTKSDDILDWKVFENLMPVEAQKEKLLNERERLKKIPFKITPVFEAKNKELNEFKEVLKLVPGKEAVINAIAKLEGEIKKLENEMAEAAKQIAVIDETIAQLSEESRDDAIVLTYREKLRELNYSVQEGVIKNIRRAAREKIFQGFILHGTPDCCLDHLSKRIAGWLGISNIEKVIYDFTSGAIEDFWQKLKNEKMAGLKESSQEGIVKELHRQFVGDDGSTQKDFVLLFRNVAALPGSDNHTGRILSFWKQLAELWKTHKAPQKIAHHIYAFIIDSDCELTLLPTLKSSREDSYRTLIGGDELFKKSIELVPPVAPLNVTEIEDWEIDECKLPAELRFDEDDLDRLLNKTGGFFRPTLRDIITYKINNPPKRELLLPYIKAIETAQL